MPQDNNRESSDSKIFKTPPAPGPPLKPIDKTTLQNDPSNLKIGIQQFPAMPVEPDDPVLPRLKSQSPLPGPPPQPPPAANQKPLVPMPKISKIIFNKITLFLTLVIVFFIVSASLILAYFDYIILTPPKGVQNFIDSIIINSPLPKNARLRLLSN